MKKTEIKKNIFKIAADVFRDTQVLFAYLFIHNYQQTYLEQMAVQSNTKDWKMVSIEKISRKFVYEFIKTDVEDIRKYRKIIMQQYSLI